ncbi:MAG: alginate lyase family protein [Marinobacter sp.]
MPIRLMFSLLLSLTLVGCVHAQPERGQLVSRAELSSPECPKEIPTPFTGPLIVESKYVQSEKSKSTLKASRSDQSEEIQRRVQEFTKYIVRFADFYIENPESNKGRSALSCVDAWMTKWASTGALTTDETSKTGIAVRKWALASLSSVMLKLKHVEVSEWTLNEVQSLWLQTLAEKVMVDYEKRLAPNFKYFNNHDYWAAWAVASTGAVLGRTDYVEWSIPFYRRAIGQIESFSDGGYGYLPNETGRKRLAANYTHYALVPLVLLSDLLTESGYEPTPEESRKLDQLVNFAAEIILDPGAVSAVLEGKQKSVPAYKLAWLIPYLSRHPQNQLARKLYAHYGGDVDGYSQAGGKLRPLYRNSTLVETPK